MNQRLIFSSSIVTIEKSATLSLLEKKRFVSSGNMMESDHFETFGRLFYVSVIVKVLI